jgi:xylulokinase
MKPKRYFAGVDVGTSVTKGIVLDLDGTVIRTHSIRRRTDPALDQAEIVWNETVDVLHALLDAESVRHGLQAITVSGMVPNIVMLDDANRLCAPSRLYYEEFAVRIEKELDAKDGTKWMNEYLSKLIYLRANEANWRAVKRLLSTHTYCIYRLAGVQISDIGSAMMCGNVFDFGALEWNTDVLHGAGIDRQIFPPVVSPTAVVGQTTDEIDALFGIRKVAVIAGSHDTVASMVGAGLSRPGDWLMYYGSYDCAAALQVGIDALLVGDVQRDPIQWTVSIPRGGQQLRQLVGLLCQRDDYDGFFANAKRSVPGANGVLFVQDQSVLRSGDSTNPKGQLLNIGLHNTKDDLCRAIAESFGYGILSYLRLEGTPKPRMCFVGGGGATNDYWLQLTSDITGIGQARLNCVESAIGTALMGIYACSPQLFAAIQHRRLEESDVFCASIGDDSYLSGFDHYFGIVSGG